MSSFPLQIVLTAAIFLASVSWPVWVPWVVKRVKSKRPQPPQSPPIPLQISCYVKGLIRSMEIEPENWEANSVNPDIRRHKQRAVMLVLVNSRYADGDYWALSLFDAHVLSDAEKRTLGNALHKLIHGFGEQKSAEDRAFFETLGCPNGQADSKS